MRPPNLPADFYWDEELQKPFRITDYKAYGAEKKYSPENIRKLDRDKAMKQENYNISRKHATTVQRSAIAGEPLGAGLSFWREIADNLGSMRYDRLSMRASVFALGLSQIVYPPRPGAADETIAHMVWDGLTNSAVYASYNMQDEGSTWARQISPGGRRRQYVGGAMRTGFNSSISSLSLSPSRVLMVTTYGAGTTAEVVLMQLNNNVAPFGGVPLPQVTGSLVVQKPSTIWCSTSNHFVTSPFSVHAQSTPSSNNAMPPAGTQFAIGYDDEIEVISEINGQWLTTSRKMAQNSPALSLNYIDPYVILSGHRNGSIRLWDLRVNQQIKRFRREDLPVDGVKRVDSNRLIAHFHGGDAALYDLRVTEFDVKYRRKQSLQRGPILKYNIDNSSQWPLGFDVNLEVGVVAAAEEGGAVKLFDLGNGGNIGDLRSRTNRNARCLEWLCVDGEGWALLGCNGAGFDKWSW